MPDAIRALFMLMDARHETLTRQVYNIDAFSLTAGEFRERALCGYPRHRSVSSRIRAPKYVDSWPEDVDDSVARTDWDWEPEYDVDIFFEKYFLPEIRNAIKDQAPEPMSKV